MNTVTGLEVLFSMLLRTHSESNPLYLRPLSGFSPRRSKMSPNCAQVWALCTNCAGPVWVCVSCPNLPSSSPSSPTSLVETGSSYTAQADLDLGFSSCLNIPSARVTAVLHPPCPAIGMFFISNQTLLFSRKGFLFVIFNILSLLAFNVFYLVLN